MKRLVIAYYDRMLLGAVLLSLSVSVGWFWQAGGEARRIRALPVTVRLLNSAYAERSFPASGGSVAAPWAKPLAQPAGAGWIYDLFTPPVVFYQQGAAKFTVLPSFEQSPVITPQDRERGVAKPELYRLQLAGYFGEEGAYTMVFINPKRAGSWRAKVGDRFADLGISVRQFSVSRVASEHKGQFLGLETVALVELWDERLGAVVKLDSRSLKYSTAPESGATTVASDGAPPLSRPATGLVSHKE